MNPPKPSPPSDSPSFLAVLGIGLAFFAAFLLWAVGFDVLARGVDGTVIEAVLNWVSRFWLWAAAGVVALSLLFGRR